MTTVHVSKIFKLAEIIKLSFPNLSFLDIQNVCNKITELSIKFK
jgi:hypothetical protein